MNIAAKLYHVIASGIKKNRFCLGLPLVYTGVLFFASLFVFGLTNHNLPLLPTIMIIAGIWGFIKYEKSKSDY
jgi:hypothetical protein